MSYHMMEALLVQEIAELRASEASVQRSLSHLKASPAAMADAILQREFVQMQTKIENIEHLIAAMEASPSSQPGLSGFIPAEYAAPRVSHAV